MCVFVLSKHHYLGRICFQSTFVCSLFLCHLSCKVCVFFCRWLSIKSTFFINRRPQASDWRIMIDSLHIEQKATSKRLTENDWLNVHRTEGHRQAIGWKWLTQCTSNRRPHASDWLKMIDSMHIEQKGTGKRLTENDWLNAHRTEGHMQAIDWKWLTQCTSNRRAQASDWLKMIDSMHIEQKGTGKRLTENDWLSAHRTEGHRQAIDWKWLFKHVHSLFIVTYDKSKPLQNARADMWWRSSKLYSYFRTEPESHSSIPRFQFFSFPTHQSLSF